PYGASIGAAKVDPMADSRTFGERERAGELSHSAGELADAYGPNWRVLTDETADAIKAAGAGIERGAEARAARRAHNQLEARLDRSLISQASIRRLEEDGAVGFTDELIHDVAEQVYGPNMRAWETKRVLDVAASVNARVSEPTTSPRAARRADMRRQPDD